MVEAVERIPIVANGDIRTIADAAATFEETGCAAISIGRGALANPFHLPPARLLGSDRRSGPRAGFRRTARADAPALPRAGRAARRALRLPAVPQDPQVVLPFHSHAQAVLPQLAQPLERQALSTKSSRRLETAGPESPLPGHYEFHVPVPSGAIDKW